MTTTCSKYEKGCAIKARVLDLCLIWGPPRICRIQLLIDDKKINKIPLTNSIKNGLKKIKVYYSTRSFSFF